MSSWKSEAGQKQILVESTPILVRRKKVFLSMDHKQESIQYSNI